MEIMQIMSLTWSVKLSSYIFKFKWEILKSVTDNGILSINIRVETQKMVT